VIAHLSAGGKLAMEMKVERSRGYVAGNLREMGDGSKSIGKLVLDASFSPVRRVSYNSRERARRTAHRS
jgi:DNA-directed RNA polymerase subunit alpha